MIKRAKIARAAELCLEADNNTFLCDDCPYRDEDDRDGERCWNKLRCDAFELLLPKKPLIHWFEGLGVFACRDCDYHLGTIRPSEKEIVKYGDFCPKCGREVDWDVYQ